MLFTANTAYASHFRGGAISWQAQDLDNDGVIDDAVVTVKTAWRSDFISGTSLSLTPSNTGVSQSLVSQSVVYVGGAETQSDSDYAFQTSVYELSNFIIGTDYLLKYRSAARISELQNNSNGRWDIQTSIQLNDGNVAPSLEFPIIYEVPRKNNDGSTLTDWTFEVDALDQNADSVRYRMANNAELGGGSSINASGLSIDATSGLITWSGSGTRTIGLYSAGMIAEDLDSAGNVISKSHVDFLLDLRDASVLELTPPIQLSDSRNEFIEKGAVSTFSFDGPGISVVALGDAQGALVETSPNNFTFTAGSIGSPLDPGVYPVTFEVNDDADAYTNSYYSVNFIIIDPDGPIISNLQDDRTPYPIAGQTVTTDKDQDASVTDVNNTHLNGGRLKLNLTNSTYANEILSINSVGTGTGEISVSGSSISYEGSVIGVIDSVLDGVNNILQIDFTSTDATLDAVAALVQQVSYNNSVESADRDLTLLLKDPDGNYNFYIMYLQIASLGISQVDVVPETPVADGVSEATVTVKLFDDTSRELNGSGGTVVVSSDLGAVSSVTDNNDGTYTATVTSTTHGLATISATINGDLILETAQTTFIEPLESTSTTLSLSGSSAVVDTSTSVTVQAINTSGGNFTLGGDAVTVNTTLGSVSAVTDNADGTYTATVTHSVTGTASISATMNSTSASNTESLTFLPGAASDATSTLSVASSTATTDDSVLVNVQLKDSNGNDLTAGGESVVITTSAGILTATTDVGDGTYTASLGNTSTGVSTITASLNSATLSDSDTVSFSPGAATSTTSSLSVNDTTPTTDDSVTVTIQAIDSNGNPLTSGDETVVISATAGSISGTVDNADGTYTATLTNATPGSLTVSATLDAAPVTDTQTVTFSPGAANVTTSSLAVSDTTPTTDETVSVTVRAIDANGNALTTGGDTVVIMSSAGSMTATTDEGDGTYTASLTNVSTGLATVTATINSATVDDSEDVNFSAGVANPTTSSLVVSASAATTDETVIITLQAVDSTGNPKPSGGDTVLLDTTLGSVTTVTYNGDGTYSAVLSSTTLGEATVSATLNGTAVDDTETVTFSVGAASGSSSTLSASDETPTTDDIVTITLSSTDAQGNLRSAGGDTVVIGTTGGTISSTTDNADGTYMATLTHTDIEAVTISATINSASVTDTATITFSPGIANATTSSMVVSDATPITDDSVLVTVQTIDSDGNALTTGGDTVVIMTSAGSITATSDEGDGSYTATLSNTSTGLASVTATINSSTLDDSEDVTFSAGAATVANSTLSADDTTPTTDETVTITVQSVDAQGNNLITGGDLIVISASAGIMSDTIDNADGSYSATLTNPVTGEVSVSASLDDTLITETTSVIFSPALVDASTSVVSVSNEAPTTDETITVFIQAVDANGNPLLAGGDSFVLTSTEGTISATTDNEDGTYGALLSKSTTGSVIVGATLENVAINDAKQILFTPGEANAEYSDLSLSENSVTTDDSVTIIVQTIDSSSNPLVAGDDEVIIGSTLGTVSPTVDTGDGTYTATLSSAFIGTATVEYILNGTKGRRTGSVAFASGAADPETSELNVTDSVITSIGTTVVTLQAKDQHRNNLFEGGLDVSFATNLGFLTQPVVDNSDGSYSASFSSTKTGTATITASVAQLPVASKVLVLVSPDVADPAQTTVTSSPESLIANGINTSQITVQLRDAAGNLLDSGEDSVSLAVDLGFLSEVMDNNDGSYTASYLTPENPGQPDAVVSVTSTVNNEVGGQTSIALRIDPAGDEDGDSVSNGTEGLSNDTDNDGTLDYLDEDDDNDGIKTADEGTLDPDSDGVANYLDIDSDGDGLPDIIETDNDTDGDSVPNYLDTDSDNDGILDDVETQLPALEGFDTDQDGLDDALDVDSTGGFDRNDNGIDDEFEVTDTDGDELPDYLDVDSDNDGVPDAFEGSADADEDGVANFRDEDSNGYGFSDRVAADISGNDTDGDGIVDEFDVDNTGGRDDNGDGIDDMISLEDLDDDGISDIHDMDIDGDNSVNSDDTFPRNPAEYIDTDEDGVGNNADADDDNDGYTDDVEVANSADPLDSRSFPQVIDSDGDLIVDSLERGNDSDGDGIDDYLEVDSDNDGIYDHIEASEDTETARLNDADSDGRVDANQSGDDAQLLFAVQDTDSDGVDDYRDLDSDNDGIPDAKEASPQSSRIVNEELSGTLFDDSTRLSVSVLQDADSDAIENFRDLDSDNDNISDLLESGGTDSNDDGMRDAVVDVNRDGYDDRLAQMSIPVVDSDKDGLPDFLDLDSDQDGLTDLVEAAGVDENGDGRVDNFIDLDGDGWTDTRVRTKLPTLDTDSDGLPDYRDLDSDNDELFDLVESGKEDVDNNGIVDLLNDADADGIPDPVDVDFTKGMDADRDGIDDRYDRTFSDQLDTDNDGIIDQFDADANGDGLADASASATPGQAAALPGSDKVGVSDVIDESQDRVHIGTTGSGCSVSSSKASDSLLWVLLVLAGLGICVSKRHRKLINVCTCMLAVAFGATLTSSVQADETRGLYLGIGVSGTVLEPVVEGTNFTLDETSSQSWNALLGYHIHHRWRGEIEYAALGEATLTPSATLAYSNLNISALFDVWVSNILGGQNNLAVFGRLGAGKLFGESELSVVEDSTMQALSGLGVDVSLSPSLSLRAEAVSYDKDASRMGASLLYRFRSKKQGSTPDAVVKVPAEEKTPESPASGVIVRKAVPQEPPIAAAQALQAKPIRTIKLVNFGRNLPAMTTNEMNLLNNLARKVKSSAVRLVITGYTDSRGESTYNRQLSEQRAQSVRTYLINQGINRTVVSVIGRGENSPVASNDTPEGRAQNRRVEIEVYENSVQ